MMVLVGVSFSTSEEGEEKESKEETEGEEAGWKPRWARPSSSTSGKKMRSFFEELVQQVMEQRFLEAHRKHDLFAQEHAMAASLEVAVISFLQRISEQTFHLPRAPSPPQPSPTPIPPRAVPPPTDTFDTAPPPPPSDIGTGGGGGGKEGTSSWWPKEEVLVLKRRSGGSREGPLVVPFVLQEELAN